MAETMKLLPCPFCGGEATWRRKLWRDDVQVRGHLGCGNDECFGPQTTAIGDDAVVQWNTRATTPMVGEEELAAATSQSTERDRVLEEAAATLEATLSPQSGVNYGLMSDAEREATRHRNNVLRDAMARIRAMQTGAAAHTRSNAADMKG